MVLVLSTLSDSVPSFVKSISQGFRVTDLKIRVDDRVAQMLTDRRTEGYTDGKLDPYIVPCLRQARQKRHDK